MDHVLEGIDSKISMVTHRKIIVFRFAKEFPFDTFTNYVICVARHRDIAG